jgi:hypothetical protein
MAEELDDLRLRHADRRTVIRRHDHHHRGAGILREAAALGAHARAEVRRRDNHRHPVRDVLEDRSREHAFESRGAHGVHRTVLVRWLMRSCMRRSNAREQAIACRARLHATLNLGVAQTGVERIISITCSPAGITT